MMRFRNSVWKRSLLVALAFSLFSSCGSMEKEQDFSALVADWNQDAFFPVTADDVECLVNRYPDDDLDEISESAVEFMDELEESYLRFVPRAPEIDDETSKWFEDLQECFSNLAYPSTWDIDLITEWWSEDVDLGIFETPIEEIQCYLDLFGNELQLFDVSVMLLTPAQEKAIEACLPTLYDPDYWDPKQMQSLLSTSWGFQIPIEEAECYLELLRDDPTLLDLDIEWTTPAQDRAIQACVPTFYEEFELSPELLQFELSTIWGVSVPIEEAECFTDRLNSDSYIKELFYEPFPTSTEVLLIDEVFFSCFLSLAELY